jgi:hypothetical protein
VREVLHAAGRGAVAAMAMTGMQERSATGVGAGP